MTYYVDLKVGGRWEVVQEFAQTRDTPNDKEVTMMVRMKSVTTGKTIEMPFSQMEMISRMPRPSERCKDFQMRFHGTNILPSGQPGELTN